MRVYTIGWIAMLVILWTLIWLSHEPTTAKCFNDQHGSCKFYQGERNEDIRFKLDD